MDYNWGYIVCLKKYYEHLLRDTTSTYYPLSKHSYDLAIPQGILLGHRHQPKRFQLGPGPL